MAKSNAKFINYDAESLENDSGALAVLLDPSGGLTKDTPGIAIAAGGVTDAMLANADIARVDENETISGIWDFSTLPTAGSNPSSDSQLARKAYVDAVATGLSVKSPCRAATTGNITLSGAQTIDGVSVIAGDRVLVKAQNTGSENGIYVCAAGAWSRATDADGSGEVKSGLFVFVEEGTANADAGFVLTTDNPITIGSTALTFVQFSGAGQITAGAGLTKSGNTINVAAADSSITVNTDSIQVAVDNSTIEVSSGLRVKDLGISTGKIADDAVTFAKMQNIATSRLLGRSTASSGNVEEITIGSGLSLTGGELSATGGGGSSRVVERFTLDGAAISNKYVTLAGTPSSAGRVLLSVKGAPGQHYGDDYQMDGGNPDRLTWDSLALDGVLASGDKLTVEYD